MIAPNNNGTFAMVEHVRRAVDDAAHEILMMRLDEALTAKTQEKFQEVLNRTKSNLVSLSNVKGAFLQTLQGVEL